MYDNRQMNSPLQGGQQFVEGTPVFDMNGDKVGTVSDHNTQGGYLTVQKGFFFPHDIYIPLNAVTRSDSDGIYLSMAKDQLSDERFKNPPEQTSQAAYTTNAAPMNTQAQYATQGTQYDTSAVDQQQYTQRTQGNLNQNDVIDVPVREEQLVAGTRPEQLGEVHLHRDVTAQQQTVDVPVAHEEVHVERIPVQDPQARNVGPDAFTEKDINVPVMGEEAVVAKQARTAEEIRLEKERVENTQRVTDTVRREQVHIDGLDQVEQRERQFDAQGNVIRQGGNAPLNRAQNAINRASTAGTEDVPEANRDLPADGLTTDNYNNPLPGSR